MLFADQKQHKLLLPAVTKEGKPANIKFLMDHLCEHAMKDTRKELFILDDHLYVCPTPPQCLGAITSGAVVGRGDEDHPRLCLDLPR